MSKPEELFNLCSGHHVYIQTHNFPDPDAIAAAYGLQKLLKKYHINSTLCYDGAIDIISTKRMVSMLDIEIVNSNKITDMTKDDYIIIIDGQKYNANFTDLPGNEVACIDHHPTYIPCEYIFSDIQMVGACSTIVASYYKELKIKPSKNVATALVYGIKMDTADFIRGGTTFDSDMFAFLYPKCDISKIMRLYSNVMQIRDLKAYSTAINNIHIFEKCGFAFLDFECPDALIATISDFILSLEEVEIAVVYSKRNEGLKFSTRSEIERIDAGKMINRALAGYGSGGGHKTMAGGVIPKENIDSLGEDYISKIESLFLKQYEIMSTSETD